MDTRVMYKLIDAMRHYECTMCNALDIKRTQRVRTLLYEAVNDVTFRKKFLKHGGFCSEHAREVRELGAPLNHAILYGALYQHIRDPLNKGRHVTRECMLCEGDALNVRAIHTQMLKAFSEPIFQKSFAEKGTLCLDHLQDVQQSLNKNSDMATWVRNTVISTYDSLNEHLESIKQKHDYRHASEEWSAAEKKAWKQMSALLSSKKTYY